MNSIIYDVYLIYIGKISVSKRLAVFSAIIENKTDEVIPYVWKDLSLQAQVIYNEYKNYIELQR